MRFSITPQGVHIITVLRTLHYRIKTAVPMGMLS